MSKIASNNTAPNHFGLALRKAKEQSGMTEAEICVKCEISTSHFYYILHGDIQPSISLVMRLLQTLKTDVPAFFKELACTMGINPTDCSGSSTLDRNTTLKSQLADLLTADFLQQEGITDKNAFGLLFKQFRTQHKVTQKTLSEQNAYTIRSIQKVERGEQDPNVQTALSMVCTVAEKAQVDMNVFFVAYNLLKLSIA